jgi:hypothetical protein
MCTAGHRGQQAEDAGHLGLVRSGGQGLERGSSLGHRDVAGV